MSQYSSDVVSQQPLSYSYGSDHQSHPSNGDVANISPYMLGNSHMQYPDEEMPRYVDPTQVSPAISPMSPYAQLQDLSQDQSCDPRFTLASGAMPATNGGSSPNGLTDADSGSASASGSPMLTNGPSSAPSPFQPPPPSGSVSAEYVRPYAPPVGTTPQATTSNVMDRGKGKEREIPPRDVLASSPAAHTPGAGQDGDDEEGGRGEKKFKNYRHLIRGLPGTPLTGLTCLFAYEHGASGKHSMKKDDYLTTLMQVPPKQRIAIAPFDLRTQREAFSVSLEGLKGWNIHALVAESSQAREDRKRRKELKKLAKTQAQGSIQSPAAGPVSKTPFAYPSTPVVVPVSTPGGPNQPSLPRTSTPRSSQNPSELLPPDHQQPTQLQGRTPVGIGTPLSASTPVPRTITPSGNPVLAHYGALGQTFPSDREQASMHAARGVKRERERDSSADSGLQVNSNTPLSNQYHDPSRPPGKGAKAGNAGVRPRPLKKQRLDTDAHGQMPIQQPTPHA
ncbi:hypothetical protein NUW54_g3002 [Trametes sanguinea]|uniref:Uncharacterized protein n=1 Tax=Trametes sanguinea TaxID=158606 RepID=A0ACC1Q480_9APHY|nr:hypothetical protein NUW54_g3002 [Trametes sanguinea]